MAKIRTKTEIPYSLLVVGVVMVVVVLVLERVFVVGGEVVAATTRVLVGRGRDLDQISVALFSRKRTVVFTKDFKWCVLRGRGTS